MAQQSLFAFDPSAKQQTFKVVFRNNNSKRVIYVSAFTKEILQQKYLDAKEITCLKRNNQPDE